MKRLNLDFFKLMIIVLLSWIAYSIHNFSGNGRYVEIDGGVLETRTGKQYDRIVAGKDSLDTYEQFANSVE